MNKYQRVVVIVIAANIALMLLFPPLLDHPLRRGVLPNFEGFYPLTAAFGNHAVHGPLLTLEILYAVINGLIAWLVLDRRPQKGVTPPINYARGLLIFGAVNLAFLLLFPPFESYSALVKTQAATFDGFYFAFGDKRHRPYYAPLLYMEVILIGVNLLVAWLLLTTQSRAEVASKKNLVKSGPAQPSTKLPASSNSLQSLAAPLPIELPLGAGPERRRRWDPRYHGSERRHSNDRRHKARTN